MVRHYNGAPRALLYSLAKKRNGKYVIEGPGYIKRSFSSKVEEGNIYISLPAKLSNGLGTCAYGDNLTTVIVAKFLGTPMKYDMLIGRLEFYRGAAHFLSQLYPINPEVHDILLITNKNIMNRTFSDGIIGIYIGEGLFGLNIPLDVLDTLVSTGQIPALKGKTHTWIVGELRRQMDAFLREY